MSRNSWCSTNEANSSTHHVWNSYRLTCQRVDSWCQQIWFGFWNQSTATLWVLDTCLIVGTPSFGDHLDRRFVIFKDVHLGITLRRVCVAWHVIHLRQLINTFTVPVARNCWMFSLIFIWLVNFGYLAPVPEAAISLPLPEAATEGFLISLRLNANVPKI